MGETSSGWNEGERRGGEDAIGKRSSLHTLYLPYVEQQEYQKSVCMERNQKKVCNCHLS